MCQGITLRKTKCKNVKEPYCYLHWTQKVPERDSPIPVEFTILNQFLPTEIALKICSYISYKVTIPLCIHKAPQKLTPPTRKFAGELQKMTRRAKSISEKIGTLSNLTNKSMRVVPIAHTKEVDNYELWNRATERATERSKFYTIIARLSKT